MPAGSTKLRFISPSSRERCSLPTIFHRSHNSSTVSWIFKRATSKPLHPSNGPSRAPICAPCWQSCNPEQPPLPPDKYVTVIPVQSTKLGANPGALSDLGKHGAGAVDSSCSTGTPYLTDSGRVTDDPV